MPTPIPAAVRPAALPTSAADPARDTVPNPVPTTAPDTARAVHDTQPSASLATARAVHDAQPTLPLTAVAAVDLDTGVVVDAIVELDRIIARLMAVRAVAINELHELALAASPPPPGGRGWSTTVTARRVAATELCAALRISEREAEQLVADSAALVQKLPTTLDGLRTGALSYRHASILIDEARSLPAEAWSAFEAAALPEAATRTPTGFRHRARALREREHPQSIDERRRTAEDSRAVYLEPGRDGMAWVTARLPAEHAIGAYRRLTEIASSLGAADEPRTLAQRRADVLTDLLVDGVMADTGLGRGVRATVLVTVPALTLLNRSGSSGERAHGAPAGRAPAGLAGTELASTELASTELENATLEGYGPISDEVAGRLAAHAPSFVRLLTHPETGTVLSVGRERYTVPRDLKLWLRIRDETCRFPGCGRAAASSDIDHTIDWQHQGATRHDNLAHLCEAHHQLKHRTDWQVSHIGGGTLEWRAPSGKRYRTRPALQLTG